MRLYSVSLPAPIGAATAGSSKPCQDIRDKWVQFTTAFTGSLNVEISLDNGATFYPIVTGVAGPGLHKIEPPATHIRLYAVTLTAGTPAATVAGYYSE